MSDPNADRGLVYLEKVRLSFPHLAAPHASAPGAVEKFSADFILEPNHPAYAQFWATTHAKALERFGAQTDQILQFIMQDRKLRCFGNGEEVVDKKTMQPMVGYAGQVYIKANNAVQPVLFDADGTRLMDARKFYGGCYVNAQVQPWIQDNQHGRAVRCELVGVQFHSDGEPFGVAPVDPNTLFGAVPGAPASIAPGQPMPGQPMPGQPMPGQPMPGQPMPGQQAPAPTQAPVAGMQPPGGYDPAMYPAPAAAPVAPQGAPAFLGVPGQPAPQGAPAPATPGQPVPGTTGHPDLPY